MNITIICFMLMLIFIMLLIKVQYRGSILGKKAGTILYIIGAGFYIGVFAYSVSVDIRNIYVSSNKTEQKSLPINRAQNVGTIFGSGRREVKSKFVQPKVLNPIPVKVLAPTTVKSEYVKTSPAIESKDKNIRTAGKIIGDKDSKIYHVPGSAYYEKELEKESNNEYFNTSKEAEVAGYRAPKR